MTKTKSKFAVKINTGFVQAKRRDFTSASKNTAVCRVLFRPDDYHPGDMMEFNMGCQSKN